MNWFCILNAGAKLDYSAPTCHRYQCQMCIDYQAGLTKPAFAVPTTILERDQDVTHRFSDQERTLPD